MFSKTRLLLIVSGALLFSCQSIPVSEIDKLRTFQTKKNSNFYSNTTKRKIIDAAVKLVSLADDGDFKFTYNDNGFVATRNWFWFSHHTFDFGTDAWVFEVVESHEKIESTVIVYRKRFLYSEFEEIKSPELYDLFRKRMDYLIGSIDKWTICGDISLKVYDPNPAICDITTMSEGYPENLSEADADRLPDRKYYTKWYFIKKRNPDRWEKAAQKDPSLRYRDK